MNFDLPELTTPLTTAKAEAMAVECASEKTQAEFMKAQGQRIGRDRAWMCWRDKFVAYATGKPWAFAMRGIRLANLALRAAV